MQSCWKLWDCAILLDCKLSNKVVDKPKAFRMFSFKYTFLVFFFGNTSVFNNETIQLLDDGKNYQGFGLCYPPRSSADNTTVDHVKFRYHAEPHPIMVLISIS